MAYFTDYDSYLFHNGTNYELYKKLGAHEDTVDGVKGTRFTVWAPNATYVSVISAKTGWDHENWMSSSGRFLRRRGTPHQRNTRRISRKQNLK